MIFTEKAATRVEEIIKEQGESSGTALRVFVEGGGCHGFSYGFGFEKDGHLAYFHMKEGS